MTMPVGFQCSNCNQFFCWACRRPIDAGTASIKTIGSRYCAAAACVIAEVKAHHVDAMVALEMRARQDADSRYRCQCVSVPPVPQTPGSPPIFEALTSMRTESDGKTVTHAWVTYTFHGRSPAVVAVLSTEGHDRIKALDTLHATLSCASNEAAVVLHLLRERAGQPRPGCLCHDCCTLSCCNPEPPTVSH